MSKKAASMAGLTEERVADLKEAFAMFDINGDGKGHFVDVPQAAASCAGGLGCVLFSSVFPFIALSLYCSKQLIRSFYVVGTEIEAF